MNKDALIIEGMRKRIGEIEVLGVVDTRLRAGDITAFIGPNGCEKSTLLRVNVGLLRPSAGSVLLVERDLSRETADGRTRADAGGCRLSST